MPTAYDQARSRDGHPASTARQTSLRLLITARFIAFFLTLATVIAPRFATVILLGALFAVLLLRTAFELWKGRLFSHLRTLWPAPPLALPVALFTGLALLGCGWSADPLGGFSKVALLLVLVVVVASISDAVAKADPELVRAAAEGFVAGMLVGAAYIVFESVTRRSLSQWLFTHFPSLQSGYEKHLRLSRRGVLHVSDANINRSTAALGLMFWPAVLAALATLSGRLRTIALSGFAITLVILLFYSRHQSTQLGLALSAAVLALASFSVPATRRLLAGGWIGALVLVVPLSLLTYRYELHLSPALFNTAKARIIIWNFTSERVLESPLLGVGTNATRELDKLRKGLKEKPEGYTSALETRAHPHNAYLHVWYELGAIGAALFGWLGLAVLAAVTRWPDATQRFALAQFTATSAVILSSYGLWQTWFQDTIAFSALALAAWAGLARRTLEKSGNTAG